MENKKILWGGVTLAVLCLVFVLGFQGSPLPNVGESDSLNYHAEVCIYKNGELQECNHNLLFNKGKNMTRDLLGTATGAPIINISLCNATAGCATPTASATETYNEYVLCGLEANDGTYAVIPSTPGNWSVTSTFTSTCDNVVTNVTRLSNDTDYFAGNTFTSVTLQTNDQLTVNWTVFVQ